MIKLKDLLPEIELGNTAEVLELHTYRTDPDNIKLKSSSVEGVNVLAQAKEKFKYYYSSNYIFSIFPDHPYDDFDPKNFDFMLLFNKTADIANLYINDKGPTYHHIYFLGSGNKYYKELYKNPKKITKWDMFYNLHLLAYDRKDSITLGAYDLGLSKY